MEPVALLVADLGNSRLKWGLLGASGKLAAVAALPLDDRESWRGTLHDWIGPQSETRWAICSVNPPLAERFRQFLEERPPRQVRWYLSAAEVPVRHRLVHPERTGADRAVAVAAALRVQSAGRPGQVVSCGTAITIESIDEHGCWLGGAILAGMGLLARALNAGTAQLPWVDPPEQPPPPAWGASTAPAIRSGLYWGTVGAVREVLTRQMDPSLSPWRIWTGGDAERIAPQIPSAHSQIIPDLILQGLARFGFDGEP